ASETYGLPSRCCDLCEFRWVPIHPVDPSQIGCKMRERGRPCLSIVATLHHTIVCTRSINSASISAKSCTRIHASLSAIICQRTDTVSSPLSQPSAAGRGNGLRIKQNPRDSLTELELLC